MANSIGAMEHFAASAVFDFVQRVAVPIFQSDGEHGYPLATGTFMKVNGQLVLITARHILDTCHPRDIAIPQNWRGSHLSTLGPLDILRAVEFDELEIDIIAIVLTNQDNQKHFASGWTVLDPSIGMSSHTSGVRDVLVVGYPSASFVREGYKLQSPPPLIIETTRLGDFPAQAKHPIDLDLDLFFDHSPAGCAIHTDETSAPHPAGMSGCSIWQVAPDNNNDVWLPENSLRLIGVQSSALPGKFLRGKSWEFVTDLLAQV